MGSEDWVQRQQAADAFFAQYIDAPASEIMRARREQGGDLEAVVAEDKAFGYWGRKMTARAARRTERELAEWAARTTQFDRLDALRIPTPPTTAGADPDRVAVVLPAPRIATLTDEERAETSEWWQRLAERRGSRILRSHIVREIRQAEQDDRFAARATAAWQREQRAFERAEWKAVVANRNGRAAKKIALQWVAISEERALAIALAAYDKTHPPQGRKRR